MSFVLLFLSWVFCDVITTLCVHLSARGNPFKLECFVSLARRLFVLKKIPGNIVKDSALVMHNSRRFVLSLGRRLTIMFFCFMCFMCQNESDEEFNLFVSANFCYSFMIL